MKQWFKKTMCLLLALITFIAAGCVPTPEEDAVIGKKKIDENNIGELTETAAPDGTVPPDDEAPLVPQELGAPEHLKESFETLVGDPDLDGGTRLSYTVNIDADIDVPESGIFPVYLVEKRELMDEATVASIVSALYPDRPAFMGPSIPFNKDDHTGKHELDPWIIRGSSDHILPSGEPAVRELDIMQGRQADGDTLWGKHEFLCYKDGRNYQIITTSSASEEAIIIGNADYYFDSESVFPSGTTLEDAQSVADHFMHDSGLEAEMVLAFSGRTRFYCTTGEYRELMGFAYVPKLNDAHMATIDLDSTLSHGPARIRALQSGLSFDGLWYPNTLRIYVDGEGIAYIKWQSCVPSFVTETVSRNAPLLPFDQILNIFQEKVGVQGNYAELGGYVEPVSCQMNVNRIELAYYRTKSGHGYNSYAYIPVWVFYGNTDVQYSRQSDSGWQADPTGRLIIGGAGYAFMVINAMDGSVIDVSKGY